jgi:hypothetical protein
VSKDILWSGFGFIAPQIISFSKFGTFSKGICSTTKAPKPFLFKGNSEFFNISHLTKLTAMDERTCNLALFFQTNFDLKAFRKQCIQNQRCLSKVAQLNSLEACTFLHHHLASVQNLCTYQNQSIQAHLFGCKEYLLARNGM